MLVQHTAGCKGNTDYTAQCHNQAVIATSSTKCVSVVITAGHSFGDYAVWQRLHLGCGCNLNREGGGPGSSSQQQPFLYFMECLDKSSCNAQTPL